MRDFILEPFQSIVPRTSRKLLDCTTPVKFPTINKLTGLNIPPLLLNTVAHFAVGILLEPIHSATPPPPPPPHQGCTQVPRISLWVLTHKARANTQKGGKGYKTHITCRMGILVPWKLQQNQLKCRNYTLR